MRSRTTLRQGARTARRQRAHRAQRVYRWPLHPNEHAQHYIMPRVIGAALNDPTAGMASLARVGVSFTRWQRWRLRLALWLGKPGWAQRIILRSL